MPGPEWQLMQRVFWGGGCGLLEKSRFRLRVAGPAKRIMRLLAGRKSKSADGQHDQHDRGCGQDWNEARGFLGCPLALLRHTMISFPDDVIHALAGCYRTGEAEIYLDYTPQRE